MTAWFWKCRSARCAEVLHSEAKFEKAPPVGFEPTHTAPEAAFDSALNRALSWSITVRAKPGAVAVPGIFRILVR